MNIIIKMAKLNLQKIFTDFTAKKGLKHSDIRLKILDVLNEGQKHSSASELFAKVRERYPTVGQATVYRTLKLLCECDICRELRTEDGLARYEVAMGHEHHDHIVCLGCGRFEEAVDEKIEKLQIQLAKSKGYSLKRHKLMLYGLCPKCK